MSSVPTTPLDIPTLSSHPTLSKPASGSISSLETVFASLTSAQPNEFVAASVHTAAPRGPDIVVVQLKTTLTIFNYHQFYNTPIHSFRPTYSALPDGSLLAPPTIQDLRLASVGLIMIGAYLLISVRNIFVSFGFIHRMKVKRQELLYTLFASQVIGPVPWIAFLVAFFKQSTNCTTIIRLVSLTTAISTWLLLSGVFGIKAYRSLNQSRIVLGILGLFQLSSIAVVAFDIAQKAGARRAAGNCTAADSSENFLAVFMMLIFAEAFFICCCFVYAVWKSSRLLAAQGRLSYRISLDLDDNSQAAEEHRTAADPVNRGWWDYTPRPGTAPAPVAEPVVEEGLAHGQHAPRQTLLSAIASLRIFSSGAPSREKHAARSQRRHHAHSEFRYPSGSHRHEARQIISPVAAPQNSRFKGLKPRMLLFREVMRDELCYITLVTAMCVFSAVMAFVGTTHGIFLKATGWFGLNWAVLSVLAVHSFGRVVQRHEQEALLRDPLLWDPRLRPDNDNFPEDRRRARRSARTMEHRQSTNSFASDQSFLHRSGGHQNWESIEAGSRSVTSEDSSIYSAP